MKVDLKVSVYIVTSKFIAIRSNQHCQSSYTTITPLFTSKELPQTYCRST